MIEGHKFGIELEKNVAQVWPESNLVNKHAISGPNVMALVTLCPLYAPGALKESKLLGHPRKY